MRLTSEQVDRELAVMHTAWSVLQKLEPNSRLRVIEWLRMATDDEMPLPGAECRIGDLPPP